jgi:protoheme ferro-lyase
MTRHVVLVTYGEPTSPSFVDQLAYSWRILLGLTRKVAAIPRPLLPVIAVSRAKGRRQLWREHAYSSPLEPITELQARRLGDVLTAAEPVGTWRMHVAYEYRHPLLGDLLRSIPRHEPVWVLPMYAAESAFTHALTREAAEVRTEGVYVLGALAPEVLADVAAAHVLEHTNNDDWRGKDVALVLAAHGTVLEPPKPIDTGLEATETLRKAIENRLMPHFGTVVNGWLNHTRGGRWTEPPIEEALAGLQAAGYSRVVYYPYGFLADNAESELEGRVALAALAGVRTRHLPCLNEGSRLLDLLAQQVRQCGVTCGGAPTGESPLQSSSGGCYSLCLPHASRRLPCATCAVPRRLPEATRVGP